MTEEKIDDLQEELNFCNCGNPEENLRYILTGLEIIDSIRSDGYAYDTWKSSALKHFGNAQAEFFFYYWAASRELTEHGGAVPGWLTAEGLDLMLRIKSALENSI